MSFLKWSRSDLLTQIFELSFITYIFNFNLDSWTWTNLSNLKIVDETIQKSNGSKVTSMLIEFTFFCLFAYPSVWKDKIIWMYNLVLLLHLSCYPSRLFTYSLSSIAHVERRLFTFLVITEPCDFLLSASSLNWHTTIRWFSRTQPKQHIKAQVSEGNS